jgi:hypothetical protein
MIYIVVGRLDGNGKIFAVTPMAVQTNLQIHQKFFKGKNIDFNQISKCRLISTVIFFG